MAKRDKLFKSDFRYVEKLLYQQKTHDTVIAELEAELEEMMPSASASFVTFDHNTKNKQTESQPEKWAIKRAESVRAKELHSELRRRRRHKKAVSEARKTLSDTENQLVWLYYDLSKSPRDCWRTMGYEKSRWYEIRQEVVVKVAEFLGLV